MIHERSILVVDDNFADAKLLTKLLTKQLGERDEPTQSHVHLAQNSDSALEFLANERAPDLLLLDLNVAGIGGLNLLESIRSTELLADLPVLVMSTSAPPSDVTNAYRLGANALVQKPADLVGLRKLVKAIVAFWFRSSLLPDRSHERN